MSFSKYNPINSHYNFHSLTNDIQITLGKSAQFCMLSLLSWSKNRLWLYSHDNIAYESFEGAFIYLLSILEIWEVKPVNIMRVNVTNYIRRSNSNSSSSSSSRMLLLFLPANIRTLPTVRISAVINFHSRYYW